MTTPDAIFISYAGTGRTWAKWVANELKPLCRPVIFDLEQWKSGDSLQDRINSSLSRTTVFIALINAEYFSAEHWSRDEFTAAYTLRRAGALSMVALKISDSIAPPLYADILLTDLARHTELNARVALRVELGKTLGEDFRHLPSPSESVVYPGRRIVSRRSFESDHAVRERLDKASSDSMAFVRESGTTLDAKIVDDWERHATDLARAYASEPPQIILDNALDLRREIDAALKATRWPSAQVQMYQIYAQASGLLSYASLDLGDAQAAYRHAIAMQHSAQMGESSELLAWGAGTQAMILRFDQAFEKSLSVTARIRLEGLSGTAKARLLAQEALGYSELHRSEDTLRAIAAAQESLAGGEAPKDVEQGIFLFPRSKMHYYAGAAFLGLEPAHAKSAAVESAKAIKRFQTGPIEDQSYSDELLAYVHLATAHLRTGDLDAIPGDLMPVLTAPFTYRTAWHMQWLDRLVVHMTSRKRLRNSTVAAEVSALFEEYILEHELGGGS